MQKPPLKSSRIESPKPVERVNFRSQNDDESMAYDNVAKTRSSSFHSSKQAVPLPSGNCSRKQEHEELDQSDQKPEHASEDLDLLELARGQAVDNGFELVDVE